MSDDRLAALELRVARLERQLQGPSSAEPPPPAAEDDVFWALEGLLARADDPGAVLLTGHATLPDGRVARWQESAGVAELLGTDWSQYVAVLAALAHPVRIRLLARVLSGVSTVHDLMEVDGTGTSGQVYHHLRQLVAAGWLRPAGNGRFEVPVARIVPLLTTLLGARP